MGPLRLLTQTRTDVSATIPNLNLLQKVVTFNSKAYCASKANPWLDKLFDIRGTEACQAMAKSSMQYSWD